MNKFKLYFLVISVGLVLFSCSKDDPAYVEPVRDYAAQYEYEKVTIEDYLKTNYVEQIVDHPGYSDDQDIIISKIPDGNTTLVSLWDSPLLFFKEVELHDITYKIYYLKAREGDTENGSSPCMVDGILASYSGSYIYDNSITVDGVKTIDLEETEFETLLYPQYFIGLDQTIRGWSEIFPLFKTGTYDASSNPENPAIFQNFGAGVMFIPSGLGYYNTGSASIPSYSPLIFSFKLYDLKRVDHDGDGLYSFEEDVNQNGDLTDDDTDGDGTYNMYDIDDDGDGKLTKNEIKNAAGETYSFDAIPDCSGNTTGLKRHLDKNCYKD